MKHTILGAGGSIGNALTAELLSANEDVRLVSRSNFALPGTTSVKADVTSFKDVMESIKGSDVVYLCVGLTYDVKIWNELWPRIIQNTIDACKRINAKLIFFDNVYMYGHVEGKMTEETPYNPFSKKGEVRARIASYLEDEIKKKNITALIARSADFYGPYATKNSVPFILAIDKLMHGKSAQWLINADKPHSFSYTTDCAKGLVLLSNRDECYNQTWHLPTYNPALTGKQFIEQVAKELNVKPNYTVLKKWMVSMAALFDKTISETIEMSYQQAFDYHFDSTKFNNYFNFKPTPYPIGISETIEYARKNS